MNVHCEAVGVTLWRYSRLVKGSVRLLEVKSKACNAAMMSLTISVSQLWSSGTWISVSALEFLNSTQGRNRTGLCKVDDT